MTTCVLSWLKPDERGRTRLRLGAGRRQFHHRRVLECKLGRPLLPGMIACHTRMPGGHPKNCIRPDHLYEGTPAGNQRDSVADGTQVSARKTHCVQGHEYTLDNTGYRTNGYRVCRQCTQAWRQQYRRSVPVKTHCPQGHPYIGENLYVSSTGGQHCRKCHAAVERTRRKKKKEN